MAPVVKLPCANSDFRTYSGKEISPLGLGFCAHSEKIGAQMVGRDGTNWQIVVKNGDKIWSRCLETMILEKDVPVGNTDINTDIASKYYNLSENADDIRKVVSPTSKPPKQKAADYDDGHELASNDVVYVVKSDKNGKKKWSKKTASPKKTASSAPKIEPTEGTENIIKKERKPRKPTAYNIFIGKQLTDLHNKELSPTESKLQKKNHMKTAISRWNELSDVAKMESVAVL